MVLVYLLQPWHKVGVEPHPKVLPRPPPKVTLGHVSQLKDVVHVFCIFRFLC